MSTTGNHPLVILGLDSKHRPHAAKFEAGQEEPLIKAAVLMGFRVGRADTDKALSVVADLPDGKFFESGKVLAPLVSDRKLDDLTENLSFIPLPSPAGVASSLSTSSDPSADAWDNIKVGDVVLLGCGDGQTEGFWDAVVIRASKKTLECVWRLAQHEAPITVQRRYVALLSMEGLKQLKPIRKAARALKPFARRSRK
jgi:hypothetical protein